MPTKRFAKDNEDPDKPLKPNQAMFVEYVLGGMVVADAAQAAGFCVTNRRSAASYGDRLLRLPHVAAELKRRRATVAEKSEITLQGSLR